MEEVQKVLGYLGPRLGLANWHADDTIEAAQTAVSCGGLPGTLQDFYDAGECTGGNGMAKNTGLGMATALMVARELENFTNPTADEVVNALAPYTTRFLIKESERTTDALCGSLKCQQLKVQFYDDVMACESGFVCGRLVREYSRHPEQMFKNISFRNCKQHMQRMMLSMVSFTGPQFGCRLEQKSREYCYTMIENLTLTNVKCLMQYMNVEEKCSEECTLLWRRFEITFPTCSEAWRATLSQLFLSLPEYIRMFTSPHGSVPLLPNATLPNKFKICGGPYLSTVFERPSVETYEDVSFASRDSQSDVVV
eukprot:TRINITY_DN98933_c0_g1_i1.p1 TRINITY_DN98933_c0_g1~~TRINITY_DN98933_c0_g1_i1.p1  ORF type:complete len:346 (+),score=52.98 TRINITY_DN98933_c0_g1_i1:110-1039(+)